jgi:pyruvate,water dikinase
VSHILWLDEIGDADTPRVGAKAASLARLRRGGLPVPDGFVLTVGGALDAPRREALSGAYGRLGGSVAVRSSSTAEDLADASFAGQYATSLDIQGEAAVARAAQECLESARDAEGYARVVSAGSGAMAVLVQRFVEPVAAGVVFTRDPYDEKSLLVESHAGRGDALVSGRVTPDRYRVDRDSGRVADGPPHASLDHAAVAALAALARRAEEELGAPVDVEWAIGAEGPVLLQARPISVEAEERPDPRVRRLTRANVGEVLPDPVTPLTWTSLGAFLEHAFRAVTATTGLLPDDAPAFLVLHRQRLYLNLSLSLAIAERLPGVSAQDAERLILGGGATGGGKARLPLAALPTVARVLVRLLRLSARLPAEIAALEERVRRLPGKHRIAEAEAGELAAMLCSFEETGRVVATTHIATSGASAHRLALLGRVLQTLAPRGPAERVNGLVAGLEGVASAAPAAALETLAQEAARTPDWLLWLAAAPESRGEAPEGLGLQLRDFLDRFGHRALSEGELRADAWEDDPAPVLAALQTLARSPHSARFRREARAEARRADESALLSRLGPFRRAVFGNVLAGAQQWVRERERTKSGAVEMIRHGRRLARAAARKLVASGALAREDDVYFLTLAELQVALAGSPPQAARLLRRRRRFEREGALPAPREVDLGGGGAEPAEESSGVLRGTPVSGGVGVGRARVAGPGETPHIEPGEVLVAPVLDAALGPVLATAAAAVAEIGGMLSHGSVVARELGIPCVVDVRGATTRIRTGDRVFVDGGSGEVRAWPEGTSATTTDGPPPFLAKADPADEAFHALDPHPLARESVYFNVQDPATGIVIVASLGVKRGGHGESLLAVGLPDGRVLFGLDFAVARLDAGIRVGAASAGIEPVRLRFDGMLAPHEGSDFPPGPIPLLLAPRTVRVALDLTLFPTTAAVDYCDGLSAALLDRLAPLGRHHVEQSGLWHGAVELDGRQIPFSGTGSRDHSWGLRDWEAADYWRLFTVRFGNELAVHALSVGCQGHAVEGGFVWRAGRAERITRVEYTLLRADGRVSGVEVEVATAVGEPLRLRGTVQRTIPVPVQLEGRLWRHALGQPYRLLLHENYTRYEAQGQVGYGMAEITERPL